MPDRENYNIEEIGLQFNLFSGEICGNMRKMMHLSARRLIFVRKHSLAVLLIFSLIAMMLLPAPVLNAAAEGASPRMNASGAVPLFPWIIPGGGQEEPPHRGPYPHAG